MNSHSAIKRLWFSIMPLNNIYYIGLFYILQIYVINKIVCYKSLNHANLSNSAYKQI